MTYLKIAEYFFEKMNVNLLWQLNLNVTCQHFVQLKNFKLSQNYIKQIIFFNLGFIYHCCITHISEVNELMT